MLTIFICLVSFTAPSSSFATQSIVFDYSVSGNFSDFSSGRIDQRINLQNQENKQISGLLNLPAKTGKHPAIIMIHGCEGFDERHKHWVRHFNDMGYVTLRIQRQGLSTPYCEKSIAQINTLTAAQIMDAYAALDYLWTLEFINVDNINIMSWESWSAIGAAATHGVGQVYSKKFNTAIAMYPDCTASYNGDFDSPLLIMVGDSDQWAQAGDCVSIQNMTNSSDSKAVTVKVYPDTYHGFDHQALNQQTHLPYAKNLGQLSNTGATAQYNPVAYLDARKQVQTFLKIHQTPTSQ